MVNELSYNTISHVIESWEQLRRIRNYEEVAGALLFQRLFEKCPQAKVLFGFPIDIDPSSQDVITSKRFLMHAAYLIQMLDTALNMLGPVRYPIDTGRGWRQMMTSRMDSVTSL